MNGERFRDQVRTADELVELIGTPSELVIKKQLTELDEHMRSFLAEARFLLLGTVDAEGRCDVSPRGDQPPVASVLDPNTLVIPERLGNRLADSLRNILQTHRIGTLFLVPGRGETLRINGRAYVIRDPALLQPLALRGRVPQVGIGVEVEECYFQCAKALIRSELWESQPEPANSGPSFSQILIDQTRPSDESVESLQQKIDESYRERLY